jgi:hypothetical protein
VGVVNDLGGISGEVADGGVDLRQCNLHATSLKAAGARRQTSSV